VGVPFLGVAGAVVGATPDFAAIGAGFAVAVGVVVSPTSVGWGVALIRSLTARATLGPAVTPVTAVVAAMAKPRKPRPIGLLNRAASMPSGTSIGVRERPHEAPARVERSPSPAGWRARLSVTAARHTDVTQEPKSVTPGSAEVTILAARLE
jgi:hypothetical protein